MFWDSLFSCVYQQLTSFHCSVAQWIQHICFINSPLSEHLGCFQFGSTITKVAMNIHLYFLEIFVFISVSKRNAQSSEKQIFNYKKQKTPVFQRDCVLVASQLYKIGYLSISSCKCSLCSSDTSPMLHTNFHVLCMMLT